MQKILLCAVNAKYIHSSLAVRYLKAFTEASTGINVNIIEFSINDLTGHIMSSIYRAKPDILCFSCYIWNIREILAICHDFKKISPQTVIILGGPEVSYEAEEVLRCNPAIDYVIRGEGEETLAELLTAIQENQPLANVPGITYRSMSAICSNQERALINNLDSIPFPYQDDFKELHDKIVYYETSRGCPFNCSYCLSSTIKGVRFFSLPRVLSDLKLLLAQRVREIKFVDRTFNCDEKRMKTIMQFIIENGGQCQCHFEIDAGLLSADMLGYLAAVPPHRFNFEIGVQSTFAPALKAVNRHSNWDRFKNNINALKAGRNIHLHLDLIAGLPYEGYKEFARSFNMVYELQPDYIQLGFLKLLPGSQIRAQARQHGYSYQENPPYQVLASKYINYGQLNILTHIAELVKYYYNSGEMTKSISYIIARIYGQNPFAFYESLSEYWEQHQYFGVGHSKDSLYNIIKQFIVQKHYAFSRIINELLKYDFLYRNHKSTLPDEIESFNPADINEHLYAMLKKKSFVQRYLGFMDSSSTREIRKQVHLEFFRADPDTCQETGENLRILFVYEIQINNAIYAIKLPAQEDTA